MEKSGVYVSVILPIKFKEEVLYRLPDSLLEQNIPVGTRVKVPFGARRMVGTVSGFKYASKGEVPQMVNGKKILYKAIEEVLDLTPVKPKQILFWERIAEYYMCTIGEVYKAAYPNVAVRQESVKSKKSPEQFYREAEEDEPLGERMPQLSPHQQDAFQKICNLLDSSSKPVLLHGVTGSGKTEIYVKLAARALQEGRSVLYMVPEIALSKQLEERLRGYFGKRLLLFHSKQTSAQKHFVREVVSESGRGVPAIVLGTRSSLFLPFDSLGLVIVDEEHDASYKQADPAPRYNARDAAVMLSAIYGAGVVMGSATPSFESLYNISIHRYGKVELPFRFYGTKQPLIEIVDTCKARRRGEMKGSFSQKLLNALAENKRAGGTALVFRNRRSYSPMVQCDNCGEIPKCPHCNVHLSYHKYDNSLRCHYCDYTTSFSSRCSHCSGGEMLPKGAGTERVEEELKELMPLASIERFDADVAANKREEERTIRNFAEGGTDILVGTQMLSKGFDFDRLSLVAVLQAETILGTQDFRADERALQLFTQLMGRAGRRGGGCRFIIQAAQSTHPLFELLKRGDLFPDCNALLEERRRYLFAPYVRMVRITVREENQERLERLCAEISAARIPCVEMTGPFVPVVEKLRGKLQRSFYVKFARDASLVENKRALAEVLESLSAPDSVVVDVDPYL